MNDSSLNIVTPGCYMPPKGKAGDSMYWNCWKGYGVPKYCSSEPNAEATWFWSESTSTSRARDVRTRSGVERGPPTNRAYGPAANAKRYVGNGSVSANRRCVGAAAVEARPLAIAIQPVGTVNSNVRRALRSGWSKQGNSAWASEGTRSVY